MALTGEFKKRYRKILRTIGRTIEEHNLIEDGDRILIGISGGKDSLVLLYILQDLQRKAPVNFSLTAYTLDQGFPGFQSEILENFYREREIEYFIEHQDIPAAAAEVLSDKDMLCSFCSRMRRGKIYEDAERLGMTKIALGHNADDAMETLLLNLFNNGRLAAIPPRILSDSGKNTIIRPLIGVDEQEIVYLSKELSLPVLPGNLCGMADRQQRQRVKQWLREVEDTFPHYRGSFRHALSNVQSRYLWETDKKED